MSLKAQQMAFAAQIRGGQPGAFGEIEATRMAVYRRLFWRNVEGYLSRVLQQTAACVGEDRWQKMVEEFFETAVMTSPIYRDLPAEFIGWASGKEWQGLPPYWLELAHFEALQMALVFAPDETAQAWLQPCAVVSYRYPVQGWQAGVVLAAQNTFMVMYRNAEHRVKWLVVSAVQARFLELAQGQPGQSQDEIVGQLKQELPEAAGVEEAVRALSQSGVIAAL